MRTVSLVACLMLILLFPVTGMATPPRPGGYAAGFLGASIPIDTDVQSFDFVNNGAFNDRVGFDPGFSVGGAGGYDFGFLRLEGELSYRRSELASVHEKGAGGTQFATVDGSLEAVTMMFNAFFDLHNRSAATPYLGGGIGFSTLDLSDTFGTDASGIVPLYAGGSDTVFAYQAGAGVELAINEAFSLDLGYRYLGTDKARFDNGDSLTSLSWGTHTALVGFRVRF